MQTVKVDTTLENQKEEATRIGQLQVRVIEGLEFNFNPSTIYLGPSVEIRVGNTTFCTDYYSFLKDKNPRWNEQFIFRNVVSSEYLIITCLNFVDKNSSDVDNYASSSVRVDSVTGRHFRVLGGVCVPLGRLPPGQPIEQWYPLATENTLQITRSSIKIWICFQPDDKAKSKTSSFDLPNTPHNRDMLLRHSSSATQQQSYSQTILEDDLDFIQIGLVDFVMVVESQSTNKQKEEAEVEEPKVNSRSRFQLPKRKTSKTYEDDGKRSTRLSRAASIDFYAPSTQYPNAELNMLCRHSDNAVIDSSVISQKIVTKEEEAKICNNFNNCHEAVVKCQYPLERQDSKSLPTKVEWFCFPNGFEVQCTTERPPCKLFHFLLVGGDMGNHQTVGICLLVYSQHNYSNCCSFDTNYENTIWVPTCVSLLSSLSCIRDLHRCLLSLFLLWITPSLRDSLEDYLIQITQEIPVPIPGVLDIRLFIGTERLYFAAPLSHSILTSEDQTLEEMSDQGIALQKLFQIFQIKTVIKLVQLILCESRILFHSQHLSLLPYIMGGLQILTYPFQWHHPFVPILPRVLVEYIQAPCPFQLGIHSSWLQEFQDMANAGSSEKLVFVNCNEGIVDLGRGNREDIFLPRHQTQQLFKRVQEILCPCLEQLDKGEINIDENHPFDISISPLLEYNLRVEFCCFFASILQGFQECLFFVDKKLPVFNKQRFCETYASADALPFLNLFLYSQAFEFFLEEQSTISMEFFHAIYMSFRMGEDVSWPQMTPKIDESKFLQTDIRNRFHCCLDIDILIKKDSTFSIDPQAIEKIIGESFTPNLLQLNQEKLREPMPKTVLDLSTSLGKDFSEILYHHKYIFTKSYNSNRNSYAQRTLSSEEEQIEMILHMSMTAIFSSKKLDDALLQDCIGWMDHQYSRDLFVLILTQQGHRSNFDASSQIYKPPVTRGSSMFGQASGKCLGAIGFSSLVKIAKVVLDHCENTEDYTNARKLLQVAVDYYQICQKPTEKRGVYTVKKEYLQVYLKKNPICVSLDMWQHALSNDIKLNLKGFPKGNRSVPEDLLFARLGSLIYDMLSLEVPVDRVSTFVSSMCLTFQMGEEIETTLQQLLENVSKALALSTDSKKYQASTRASTPRLASLAENGDAEKQLPKDYDLDTVIWRRLRDTASIPSPISLQFNHSRKIIKSFSSMGNSFDDTFHDFSLGGTVLKGHKDGVLCLADVSTDPSLLLSGGLDNQGIVWNIVTGSIIHQLEGHTAPVSCVEFISSHCAVTASYDSSLRVWDLVEISRRYRFIPSFMSSSKKRLSKLLRGHSGAILCTEMGNQVTPNGHVIISGSVDATIRLWHSDQEVSQSVLIGHKDAIGCLKIYRQHNCLISGSHDGSVNVWDMEKGIALRKLAHHTAKIQDLSVSGDRLVSASNDCTVKLWDLRSSSSKFTQSLEGHSGAVTCLALGGPSDPNLVTGSSDGLVKIWDLRSVRSGPRLDLQGHQGRLTCLGRSFTKVVSGCDDAGLRVWDLHTGKCLSSIGGPKHHSNRITSLILQESCFISGSLDHSVQVWSEKTFS